MPDSEPPSLRILGMRVCPTSYQEAVERILGWARCAESRYVCAASVNNVMEAHDSAEFLRIMNQADLVTPDGNLRRVSGTENVDLYFAARGSHSRAPPRRAYARSGARPRSW